MKRKIFAISIFALFAIGAIMSTNVNKNVFSIGDISIMAKAQMTSDEFTEKTGCNACICETSCKGKDGNTYSAATKPAKAELIQAMN
ncbi:hypothetical protein [Perlabentimonas gracilis]|uniref:hypothetical protein n=1 Tax=Perlabentimonas gracilis TaxID=2715279 RepID=UPI001407FE90|nr:hypothetical protein [Perlabentimonas gracilis]NHB69255.1 hypothetical protein [Perlabentimonas gracilis]